MLTAKALLDFANVQYKSNGEKLWAAEGALLICAQFGTRVELTLYEPMTFNIPGGHYTPDFLHILQTGEMVFVEIKASTKQKGYRDARSKLRAAAEVYPYFYWIEAITPSRTTPNWSLEQIGRGLPEPQATRSH